MGKVLHAGDAHAHYGVLKERVIAGHDQITDPGQHQAARHASALHHGNQGFGNVAPAAAHAQINLLLAGKQLLATGLVGVIPPQVRTVKRLVDVSTGRTNIVPRAEVLACTAQHDDLDAIVIGRLAEGSIQRIGHLRVLHVVERGPIHGDRGNALVHAVEHRLVGFVDGLVFACHKFAGSCIFHIRLPWP